MHVILAPLVIVSHRARVECLEDLAVDLQMRSGDLGATATEHNGP